MRSVLLRLFDDLKERSQVSANVNYMLEDNLDGSGIVCKWVETRAIHVPYHLFKSGDEEGFCKHIMDQLQLFERPEVIIKDLESQVEKLKPFRDYYKLTKEMKHG